MAEGEILSKLLQQEHRAKPGTSLQDCIVGPSLEERQSQQPWGTFLSSTNIDSNDQQKEAKKSRLDQQITTSSTFSKAISTFLTQGCCVIPDCLPKEYITNTHKKATNDLQYLSQELHHQRTLAVNSNQDHLLARALRADFRELIDRDGSRRDVRFQLDRYPFTSPGLVYNPIVYPLVKELLGGGEITLLYQGIMFALPQPKPKKASVDDVSQKFHADGPHLFHHTHLPPHCINVFYPLIDLNSENGPTEVTLGSHKLGKLKDENLSNVDLCCDAGGAVLFDYRLNHRGKANFSTEPRPILYLAYGKSFFQDSNNCRSGHSIISSSSERPRVSPKWESRILSGEAVPFGLGFDCPENFMDEDEGEKEQAKNGNQSSCTNAMSSNAHGSGERFILFKMNIEIPGCDEAKAIVVHYGDIAEEVASSFCREHQLASDFIPILAQSIDAQMQASLK